MVTLVLEAPGSRPPSIHFFKLFFLEFFPSMSFSLSIVAVLVSVSLLEAGVKKIAIPGGG